MAGHHPEFSLSKATFSPCRTYRYTLARTWNASAPTLCWILLNPSTADERKLDPTLRRCLGFSRAWGFGSMVVVNLFALRSPYPRKVYAARDPIGPKNDMHIRRAAGTASQVIVGWGVHGKLCGRDAAVLKLLAEHKVRVWCLGMTKDCHPKHPLYVAASTDLVHFSNEG
jgi:hypothetical protein